MARRSRRNFSDPSANDPRRKGLVFGLGAVGLLVGGAAGYAFGYFVLAALDTGKQFIASGEAGGAFGMWALALGGAIGGARWGEALFRSARSKQHAEARRARYKEQLERYEQEKAETEQVDDGYGRAAERIPAQRKKAKKHGYESPWP